MRALGVVCEVQSIRSSSMRGRAFSDEGGHAAVQRRGWPYPASNDVRWILGHLLVYVAWVADVVDGDGGGRAEAGDRCRSVRDADEFWSTFEPCAIRRRARSAALEAADPDRLVTYLDVPGSTVGRTVRTNAAHGTGHTWQVEYVRGAFSRA